MTMKLEITIYDGILLNSRQPFQLVFPEFFENLNFCLPLLEVYNANHATVICYFAKGTE